MKVNQPTKGLRLGRAMVVLGLLTIIFVSCSKKQTQPGQGSGDCSISHVISVDNGDWTIDSAFSQYFYQNGRMEHVISSHFSIRYGNNQQPEPSIVYTTFYSYNAEGYLQQIKTVAAFANGETSITSNRYDYDYSAKKIFRYYSEQYDVNDASQVDKRLWITYYDSNGHITKTESFVGADTSQLNSVTVNHYLGNNRDRSVTFNYSSNDTAIEYYTYDSGKKKLNLSPDAFPATTNVDNQVSQSLHADNSNAATTQFWYNGNGCVALTSGSFGVGDAWQTIITYQ